MGCLENFIAAVLFDSHGRRLGLLFFMFYSLYNSMCLIPIGFLPAGKTLKIDI